MQLVSGGSALEGAKVSGHSRNPLKSLGLAKQNGERYEKYRADHDVKSSIVEAAEPPPTFFAEASLDAAATVVCERALICTFDKRPAQAVSPGSASHKANHWTFSKRTAVRVDRAHAEIQRAIENRQLPK